MGLEGEGEGWGGGKVGGVKSILLDAAIRHMLHYFQRLLRPHKVCGDDTQKPCQQYVTACKCTSTTALTKCSCLPRTFEAVFVKECRQESDCVTALQQCQWKMQSTAAVAYEAACSKHYSIICVALCLEQHSKN